MITLSLCMIVRNEEATLGKCLECMKDIADEIIIVDTGSTDRTKAVAATYTNKIYDMKWEDDFSVARNFSFSKATKEYVMWLDADDIILPKEQQKLKKLKEVLDEKVDIIYMKYNLGMSSEGKVEGVFWRERIVKREKQYKWHEPVHEYLLCEGNILKVDVAINHTNTHLSVERNIAIFEKYMEKGNELTYRQCFHYGRELYLVGRYDKAIHYYERFLEWKDGLKGNYMTACTDLAVCYEKRKEEEKILKTLLRYFEYDIPRAEICCVIGYYYKDRQEYEKAIEWFKLAPHTKKPTESIGLMMPKFWDYVPYMELCACYFKLGKIDEAIYYNEQAALNAKEDPKVLHNRCFLAMTRERIATEKEK